MVETMPQTKEVEDFLKSIGPFYVITDSDEEGRATFTPNNMDDDVTGETTNQSVQIGSQDPNISVDLETSNTGISKENIHTLTSMCTLTSQISLSTHREWWSWG